MIATTRAAPATPIITTNSIVNMGGEIGVVVDDALELVAYKFFDDVEIADDMRDQTVVMCKLFHQNVVSLSEK